jgi:hypothetical protein
MNGTTISIITSIPYQARKEAFDAERNTYSQAMSKWKPAHTLAQKL